MNLYGLKWSSFMAVWMVDFDTSVSWNNHKIFLNLLVILWCLYWKNTLCFLFFFKKELVVNNLFATQYIVDFEGNVTVGNWLLNLIWQFFRISFLYKFPQYKPSVLHFTSYSGITAIITNNTYCYKVLHIHEQTTIIYICCEQLVNWTVWLRCQMMPCNWVHCNKTTGSESYSSR